MIGPQLADENLIESIRMHARWQSPADIEERDGVLMIAGATHRPGPYSNCAIRLDAATTAGRAFEMALEFFGARGRGFVLLTRSRIDQDMESLLADAGIHPRASSPCMILNRSLEPPVPAPGVELYPVNNLNRLRDSVAVNMEAYPRLGLPSGEVAAYFEHGGRVLEDSVCGCVAYRDGQPLATALTYITGTCAGVYWVGTVAAAERQGLGEACARHAVNAGFGHGARLVTLQASPFGRPLYERLGFRRYDLLSYYIFSRSQIS